MSGDVWEQIMKYIDDHICEKISLNKLSEIAGYSPFYFSVLFSEAVGVSVSAYIRIRKLQYAMADLLKGEKVVDISFEYGFESHEGFTRSFTRLFGSTPKNARKYLATYTVPTYVVPVVVPGKDGIKMKLTKNLFEDMHQILFAFLEESVDESKLGNCTEIEICLLPDNQIRVADNGRGLPLSDNKDVNRKVFENILAGYPLTKLDYERMEEIKGRGLQAATSLCEKLEVLAYKNNRVYKQCFVRGIAQHELISETFSHKPGMEILFTPDKEIFGETKFSKERMEQWLQDALKNVPDVEVNILE